MSKEDYLTVGELAEKAGVTVRTIQYYDQEGLLSPSARGPQNQRLYTEEDVNDLYRILSLKYMNLSLAEIKSHVEHVKNNQSFSQLIKQQMDEIEKSIQQIFKRFTTLRSLMEMVSDDKKAVVNWEEIARTINDCQDEDEFFWRLTYIRENESDEEPGDEALTRQEMVSLWHELIADTIRLMADKEPLDSPRNLDLARRYLMLDQSQQALSIDQNFILMENIAPHKHDDGSFDALRTTVIDHLEAVAALVAKQEE